MRQKTGRHQSAAEHTIKDIRRQTRKRYSFDEKIRVNIIGMALEEVELSVTAHHLKKRTVHQGSWWGHRLSRHKVQG